MGAVQAYVNCNTEMTFTSDLNAQIQCCGTISHPAFGNIQLWKMKNKTTIEIFSLTRHVYYQDSMLLTIHQQRTQLKHPNLLQYYACTQNSPSFCGNVETQQFYFEYISQTLSQYLCARSEPFREIEVWKSLEQLISVLQYLQQNGYSHGKITSDNIMITQDQTLKTLDQITIQSSSQQIKQDVYDLAQVMVELMTKKKFHLSLKETVISLVGEYSQQLLQLLARMLNNTPEKRPDFIELSQILIKRQYRSTSTEKEVPQQTKLIRFQDPKHVMTQRINKLQTQNVYSRSPSPQKIISYSPQRLSPYKVSPQRVRVLSPIKTNQIYSAVNQFSGIYRTASPVKGNITGSQASTVGSYGVSMVDAYKTQFAFYTQRGSRPNKILIPQHKSDVKRKLFKDDLNQTSSSQPPIEIVQ
ncbi:unnamed protein product (macronuclear) [Paramecium tetraurelia]|uniref:Protein kinase domain-containing protein n=1 Tax=Paramecium tetraurelia TaxID=5888 RepID=A0CB67_PARTE|nr:uncharacterized protein GSPATT00036817001 [Paramecium tetraurelia]CAK68034.1 unnamed protein product [Paramecium tetraurelia]|eukprot:XP_001435431.1 hypothetical protein (macronuclear) [Paramecium tetraurelia strain d4-2]